MVPLINISKIKVAFCIIISCLLINVFIKVSGFTDISFAFSTYFSSPLASASLRNDQIKVTENLTTTMATSFENVSAPELPLILGYDKVWRMTFFSQTAVEALKKCPFKCRWSDDKR